MATMSVLVIGLLAVAASSVARDILEDSTDGRYGCSCPPQSGGGLNFGGLALVPQEDVLPLPDVAIGLPVDMAVGYATKEISPGLFIATDSTYVIMFAVTSAGVVLVDCPPTMGARILSAIGNVTDEKITTLVYSHQHQDHIAGCGSLALDESVTIISSKATADELAELADPKRPLPTKTFEKEYKFSVGGLDIEVSEMPDGHTDGDIFIFIPSAKAVMSVDIAYPGWVPFNSVALVSNLAKYLEALKLLLEFDAEHFVCGHLNKAGTRKDMEQYQEYIMDLVDAGTAAVTTDTIKIEDTIAQVGPQNANNNWVIAIQSQRRQMAFCYDMLAPKWAGVLGAFDVYTHSHCLEVLNLLVVD